MHNTNKASHTGGSPIDHFFVVVVFVSSVPPNTHLLNSLTLFVASNKLANWFLAKGIKRGDIVSLFMPNKPEFIFCWLGLNKIGATAAFINTNLAGKPLTHSLNTASASILVMDTELASQIANSLDEILNMGYTLFSYGSGDDSVEFATPIDLSHVPDTDAPAELRRGTTPNDIAMLIYTSGTTGLPKAGRFSHTRASSTYILGTIS